MDKKADFETIKMLIDHALQRTWLHSTQVRKDCLLLGSSISCLVPLSGPEARSGKPGPHRRSTVIYC